MASKVYSVTIDCRDPERVASFWSAALGFEVTEREEDEVTIEAPDRTGWPILFGRAPDAKRVKNRIHFDLNPEDQGLEVERLMELGATKADIGQGDVSWVVMADPEGNEFCVLTSR